MPAQKLDTLLLTHPSLRPLIATARRLAEVQRIYEDLVPARLSRFSRVSSLEGTTLIIAADNGTVAAKLKQLVPALVKQFLLERQEFNSIIIRVQVRFSTPVPAREKRALSALAQQELSLLEASLRPSPLKTAVAELLKPYKR